MKKSLFKKRAYIIAEIGINHDGNFRKACKLVEEAKKSGADAVKFQVFKPETLAGNFSIKSSDQKKNLKNISLKKFWIKMNLNYLKLKKLKSITKKMGMDFICSVFDLESLNILNKIGVDAFKVASSDLTNHLLISNINKTKKPLIISTGMSKENEIKEVLKLVNKKNTFLLHCVSMYPCKPKLANLKRILSLKKKFKIPIGYSDHTIGINACIESLNLGAKIIEKHFTLNSNVDFGDHKFSAEPSELKLLTDYNKSRSSYIGNGAISPSNEESKFIKFYRKGIYLKADSNKGSIIFKENLKFIRQQKGLKSEDYKLILGKKLKVSLKKNTPLKRKHFI